MLFSHRQVDHEEFLHRGNFHSLLPFADAQAVDTEWQDVEHKLPEHGAARGHFVISAGQLNGAFYGTIFAVVGNAVAVFVDKGAAANLSGFDNRDFDVRDLLTRMENRMRSASAIR